MDQAVADGANVIVLSGYVFAPTVIDESDLYPEVKFLALDVSAGDICEKGIGEGYDYNPDHYNVTDYYNEDNVYCCTYQEELSGFMAGYAAVMLGYRHLGFLGGMSVPAVNRYGYGYVQGADAAAKELGITWERMMQLYRKALRDTSGKIIYDTEFRIRTKSGEYRWFRSTGRMTRKKWGRAGRWTEDWRKTVISL